MTAATDVRIALLERDSAEMKQALTSISDSLSRLVALEERHSETREAIGRAFKQIDLLDERVALIEHAMPALIETRNWVLGLFGLVLSGVAVAVVALVVK